MKIKEGTIITVDGLRFDADWEFDCPVLILRPVIKYSPNGESIDSMIEDLCIDAAIDEEIVSEDVSREFEWRGWNINYFKRVFVQALKGKNFPKRKYEAERQKIKFYRNSQGELEFIKIKDTAALAMEEEITKHLIYGDMGELSESACCLRVQRYCQGCL